MEVRGVAGDRHPRPGPRDHHPNGTNVARITEHVRTPLEREAAFDHLADFTTTAAWDPGIARAERLDDGPIGLGSRFRVHLRLGLVTVPLVYEITAYDRADHLVLDTRSPLHRGRDDVRFRSTLDGTEITWDAEFAVTGPFEVGRLLDPVLGVGFRRAAREAVDGLARALEGRVLHA